MSSKPTKYVIISPVRDEEANLARTIEAVASQSVLPSEWVIVNDGSSDRTAEIAESYARQHNWIKVCHRQNRGFRKSGGGVVDAFNDGYRMLETSDWNYVVKLDGDLSFDPEYFRSCFQAFEEDPKLRNCRWHNLQRDQWPGDFGRRSGVSCSRRDEDLPPRMLGRYWRLLAGAGLGYDG